jgi:nitrogenase subunit NifH
MNGKYLINRRYVCFKCNLNEEIDQLKSSYKKQLSSLISNTKQKTFEASMTEKFHTQKISLTGCIFIQSVHEAEEEKKERVKNRWKK